jgi:hypothetical protein
MKFWRKKETKPIATQSLKKSEVLNGLRSVSAYFERNIQNHEIFRPEFEVSRTINNILETKDPLTKSDVTEILNLCNGIEKVEHYDGSGWLDYRIRLSHFLRMNGFEIEFKDKELRLTERL